MSDPANHPEAGQVCTDCGRFGAQAFGGGFYCVDCVHQRGSCCAERPCDEDTPPPTRKAAPCPWSESPDAEERHRLNPNCCYQACPGCTSLRRLRDFQSRHPRDWRARLIGSPRLVAVAQNCE